MFEYMYDHTSAGKLELQTKYMIHKKFERDMRHLKSCLSNTLMVSMLGTWMIYFGGYDAVVGLIGLAMWIASASVLMMIFREMKHLRRN